MKKTISLSAIAVAMMIGAVPAQAQEAGDIQVKVLGTFVLPDGKVKDIEGGTLASTVAGLGVQTEADNNFVPTIAIEYFATPNISLETICCVTQHDVSANAPTALAGAQLVSDVRIIPATLTVKYHFGQAGGIRPYVGAGPSYFFFFNDEAGAGARSALGATRARIDDTFAFALQAGIDVPVNANGMSVTLDAKRYFLRPDAHFYNASGTELLETHHRLDPWVLSAGVALRF